MTVSRYAPRRSRGRPPYPDVLTRREWEVYYLVRMGLTNQEIAECLGISFAAAKFHVAEVIGRLGLSRRGEVAAIDLAPRQPLRTHGVTALRQPAEVRPGRWGLRLAAVGLGTLFVLFLLSVVLGGGDHALLFPALAVIALAVSGVVAWAISLGHRSFGHA